MGPNPKNNLLFLSFFSLSQFYLNLRHRPTFLFKTNLSFFSLSVLFIRDSKFLSLAFSISVSLKPSSKIQTPVVVNGGNLKQ